MPGIVIGIGNGVVFGPIAGVGGFGSVDNILLEDGFNLLQESGTAVFLLE